MILIVFLVTIFACMLIGVPIAFSILITVLSMAEASGVTCYAMIPSYMWSGVNNFALMASKCFGMTF